MIEEELKNILQERLNGAGGCIECQNYIVDNFMIDFGLPIHDTYRLYKEVLNERQRMSTSRQ